MSICPIFSFEGSIYILLINGAIVFVFEAYGDIDL